MSQVCEALESALTPNLLPPRAGIFRLFAVLLNIGPPDSGIFRLIHDGWLVSPSGKCMAITASSRAARSLQHRQAAQLIGLSAACTGKRRSVGPEAHNALTIKPDHPMGAHHPGDGSDLYV